MPVRGRISRLPVEATQKKDEIIKLYYEEGYKQKQIKEKLGLPSISVVAEVLRRDMIEVVDKFKKVDPNSADYKDKALDVIKFLKNYRKLDYSSIATMLGLRKDVIFKIISDEQTGLRNSLSIEERLERNEEMKRLSIEEGLSLTEIGKRMGLSKQMVSRIFTDMGYRPIRGTRQVQILTQTNIPQLTEFIREDCNAKLKELAKELRKVKGDFASNRQYNNKVIAELRCLYIQEVAKHLTSENFEEFVRQVKFVKTIYKQFLETTTPDTRPPQFKILEETVKIIEAVEYSNKYDKLENKIKKGK